MWCGPPCQQKSKFSKEGNSLSREVVASMENSPNFRQRWIFADPEGLGVGAHRIHLAIRMEFGAPHRLHILKTCNRHKLGSILIGQGRLLDRIKKMCGNRLDRNL